MPYFDHPTPKPLGLPKTAVILESLEGNRREGVFASIHEGPYIVRVD